MRLFSIILLFLFSTSQGFSQTFNVINFGAVGDSITLNTASIQAAIDSCSNSGGGQVLISQGIYLTGTLRMKSNVDLHIDSSATLKGSPSLSDYPTITPQLRTYTDAYVQRSLIYAEGVRNIAFTGKGKVNGNGLTPIFLNNNNRVFGFRIYSSTNVRYENLILKNSAFWMMHNCNLDTVLIKNLTITNHCFGNQDGVNLDMCRNALVENCDIDGNDDALVLKGTALLSTQNVEVRNCTFATYSRAIKIGTETQGFFNNIYIHDCVVKKSTRGPLSTDATSGINLSIVDGGGMDGVRIENITLEAETPIVIRLGNRANKYMPSAPTPGVGYLKNIALRNITATATTNTTSHITGIPNYRAENILLENIDITIPGGMDSLPNFSVPENETKKPENTLFGDTLPTKGFFLRHINGIKYCDIKITELQPDLRPEYNLDDVTNSNLTCVTSIENLSANDFKIYPNPASAFIQIEDINTTETIEIYDVLGQKIPTVSSSKISIANWKKGIYFLHKNGTVKRFVKE